MKRFVAALICMGLFWTAGLLGAGTVVAADLSGDLTAALKSELASLEAHGFSGAVHVVVGDKVLLREGFGLRSQADAAQTTPSTLFDVGSITKHFTAAAIVKLSKDGKVNIEDSIGRYLPGLPSEKAAITVRHLLT